MKTRFLGFTSTFAMMSVLFSDAAFAQDISHEHVTATTTLNHSSPYSIDQISDGISADCAPTCNGFTTDSKTGTISFSFDQPHDIDGIKIWNDVAVRKEGIKTFELEFKNAANTISSSHMFEAVSGQAEAQTFKFPKVQNVTSVNLIVLSSLLEDGPTSTTRTYRERIEVREVGFIGSPSAAVATGGDENSSGSGGGGILSGLGDITINFGGGGNNSGDGGGNTDALQDALTELEEEKNTLESEKATLESENADLDSRIDQLISEKTDLERRITSLEEQLAAVSTDDETGPLLEEIARLNDRIRILESREPVDNSGLLEDITRLNDRIRTLEAELEDARQTHNPVDPIPVDPNPKLVAEIAELKERIKPLDEEIIELKDRNKNQQELINKQIQIIKEPLKKIEEQEELIKTQADNIEQLNAEIDDLKSDPHPLTPSPGPWKAIAVALGLLSAGLGAVLLWRKPKSPQKLSLQTQDSLRRERPSKPLERPDDVGVLFSGSPLLAANVAAPLSTAGQLTASSLQMLSGQFAALRPAYQATGRIGYAQEGKPSGEDYAFGTGFLVSPNHVITNRHVHGFYSEYLTGADCGGIEFIAEKDKDASDFYEFDGNPPVLVPGLDIAIYTLAKSVNNREPIARIPLPTDSLEGREIVVVGYPDTFNPDDPELLKALEKDPVFAVKRISQGHIFRHSTDTDDPYGVQATVTENETTEFPMSAICHNASTMTGNSGSPILDAKTGELLGVHFAGYKIFNKKEAANLAMAIAYIVEQHDAHSPNLLSTKSHSKESTGLKTA